MYHIYDFNHPTRIDQKKSIYVANILNHVDTQLDRYYGTLHLYNITMMYHKLNDHLRLSY